MLNAEVSFLFTVTLKRTNPAQKQMKTANTAGRDSLMIHTWVMTPFLKAAKKQLTLVLDNKPI